MGSLVFLLTGFDASTFTLTTCIGGGGGAFLSEGASDFSVVFGSGLVSSTSNSGVSGADFDVVSATGVCAAFATGLFSTVLVAEAWTVFTAGTCVLAKFAAGITETCAERESTPV